MQCAQKGAHEHMVRIISDTSTMYSTQQAREAGFAVSPLAVTIAGESYRELDEMSAERFVGIIRDGHMPISSQPAIGEVMDLYEEFKDDEILNITIADGLSGTYSSAVSAANTSDYADRITVLNTETLCGPHRYMVETANRLAQEGATLEALVAHVKALMEKTKSYLIPEDFDYLRRGGRLSPLVSFIGKTIKLAPVMTLTPGGRQLTASAVKRSFKQAIAHVGKELQAQGIKDGAGWRIYVVHGEAKEKAQQAAEQLRELFRKADFEIHPLTPAFITQGGPGCVAVQSIKLV